MDDELKEFDFGIKDIGVFLLESITTGLYKEPLHVIREYISNELDNYPPPSKIELTTYEDENKILIAGDGPGMDFDNVRDAVRVGFSPKDKAKNIGFRGIGIYSGVSICERILIYSKKKDSNIAYQIQIHCKGLRKDIEKGAKIALIDSLKKNVKYKKIPVDITLKKSKGTSVQLIEILPDYQKIFNKDTIRKYLEMTVPLQFNPKFDHASSIMKYLKQYLKNDFLIIDVKLNNSSLYRSPSYLFVEKPVFGKIFRYNNLLAIYWLCLNNKSEKIPNEDSQGLIYKKKGFTIGDRSTIRKIITKNANLVPWVVGEIHIVNDKLLPNAERVEFEQNIYLNTLENKIKSDVIQQISKITREKSAIIRAEERVKQSKDLDFSFKYSSYDEGLFEYSSVNRLKENLLSDSKKRFFKVSLKNNIKRAKKRTYAWMKRFIEKYEKSNPEETSNGDDEPIIYSSTKGAESGEEQKEQGKEECNDLNGEEETEEGNGNEEENNTITKEFIETLCSHTSSRLGRPDLRELLIIISNIIIDKFNVNDPGLIEEIIKEIELSYI